MFRKLSSLILFFCLVVLGHGSRCLAADPPFQLPKRSDIAKIRTAKITTDKGSMIFDLFPDEAPWHVANFKYLADKGFYRGLSFHIFHENYIIQGGEPPGKFNGPGYSLPAEFSARTHQRGSLGMARRQDLLNPERRSNGSQFHILLSSASHMDGSYTIFGSLRDGDEVLSTLEAGDRIKDIKVFVRTE